MPDDYCFVKNLISKLNIDQIIDQVTILPKYDYIPEPQVTGITLLSKNIDYLCSIARGLNKYLGNQQSISVCKLPIMPNSESFKLFQDTRMCILELNISIIQILCQKLNLNFEDVYKDCEPKINPRSFNCR